MNKLVILYEQEIEEAVFTTSTAAIAATHLYDFLDSLPEFVEKLKEAEDDKAGSIDDVVTNALKKTSENASIMKKIELSIIKAFISYILKKEAVQERIPSLSYLIEVLTSIGVAWQTFKSMVMNVVKAQYGSIKSNIDELEFIDLVKNVVGLPKILMELFRDLVSVAALSGKNVASTFKKEANSPEYRERFMQIRDLVAKNNPKGPPEARKFDTSKPPPPPKPRIDTSKPPPAPNKLQEQLTRMQELAGIKKVL